MTASTKRIWIWLVIGTVLALWLIFAFRPRALPVDQAQIVAGPMVLTVGDEGETQVVDVFVVSAPITGRVRRVESEPGDVVVANETVVAEIEPTDPDLLDPRSEAQAQAQLSAAVSAEALAQAELEKSEADFQFAEAELKRARELVVNGTISERELESAERAYKTSQAAIGVSQATLQVRKWELERVRAQLMTPTEIQSRRSVCECVFITSPVDGQVLRVLRESEGFVTAGEGLVEIGNADRLEIIVDLLSVDAVKVEPGQDALIENWGGDRALNARVRRVEPFGFTKVSALGIEEQRVNVILDLVSPRHQWERLGHGYQIEARIVLWREDDVLKVPLTALFRVAESWALFVVEDGRVIRREVEIGIQTDSEAQVLAGVNEGDWVVTYPGEGIEEGVRVAAR